MEILSYKIKGNLSLKVESLSYLKGDGLGRRRREEWTKISGKISSSSIILLQAGCPAYSKNVSCLYSPSEFTISLENNFNSPKNNSISKLENAKLNIIEWDKFWMMV